MIDIEAAIEKLWEEVEAQRAASIVDAYDLLYPFALSPEADAQVRRHGLTSMAHDRQKGRRANGKQPIAFGRPHGRQWVTYMTTLSAPFEGADGREKSLLDFKAGDYAIYRARCITIGTAYLKRAKAAEHMIKMLAKYEVIVTRDLPAEVLEDAAARFDEAFR